MKNVKKLFLIALIFVPPRLAAETSCTLKVAVPAIMMVSDPIKAMGWWEKRAVTLQYDTLVRFDNQGGLQPWLAKRWAFSPDLRTLEIELRPGVRFSNQRPMTAKDVVASLTRLIGPGSVDRERLKEIESISAKGELALEIKLRQPFMPLLYYLATPRAGIVKKISTDRFIGTGPWIFNREDALAGRRTFLFSRNEIFFRGPPKCNALQLVQIPPAEMATAFKEHVVDLVEYFASKTPSLSDLRNSFGESAVIQDFPSYDVTAIFFTNHVKDSLAPEERRWLMCTIKENQSRFVIGMAQPACALLPLGFMKTSATYCASPEGLSIQRKPRVLRVFAQDDERSKMLYEVQRYLRQFGVRVEISLITLPEMYKKHAAGKVAAHVETLTMQIPEPFGILSLYLSGVKENFSKFSNKKFDELLNKAVREPDILTRNRAYREAERILHDEVVALPLAHQSRFAIFSKSLLGYSASSVGPFYTAYDSVSKETR